MKFNILAKSSNFNFFNNYLFLTKINNLNTKLSFIFKQKKRCKVYIIYILYILYIPYRLFLLLLFLFLRIKICFRQLLKNSTFRISKKLFFETFVWLTSSMLLSLERANAGALLFTRLIATFTFFCWNLSISFSIT